ncbi:MAG: ester cyclase [Saprospiraceae bacterium]
MKTTAFFAALLLALNTIFASEHAGQLERKTREFFLTLDAADYAKLRGMLAPGFKFSAPFLPASVDAETYIGIQSGFKTGFPDIKHAVVEGIESGNTFAFQGHFSGTNTGTLQGNPPSGNRVSLPFQAFLKFDAAGKISDIDVQFDNAAFVQQLTAGLPAPASEQAKNKQTVLNFYDWYGAKHDVESCVSLFDAAVFKIENGSFGTMDLPAFKQLGYEFLKIFPDLKMTVEHIVAEGDLVIATTRFTGTQQGDIAAIPATGKKVDYQSVDVWRLKDGKLVWNSSFSDDLKFLQQLGAIPNMGK